MSNRLVYKWRHFEFGYFFVYFLILFLGTDAKGFGFGGTGKKSTAAKFEDYGESFTLNDVLGCYIDLAERTIHYSKNGKEYPIAFEIPNNLQNSTFYPAVLLKVHFLPF